jgi:hypothetical protein
MVAVPRGANLGAFCIDRYEASLVDRRTGAPLSPYYPPHRKLAQRLHDRWEQDRFTVGGPSAQALPVPPLPGSPSAPEFEPMAISLPGAVPNGYLSGVDAELACKNAGKRLCRHEEWVRACKGRRQLQYPYGDTYRGGVCNIFRTRHPAAELHDDASIGHLDPRLNLVKDEKGDRLLRLTGGTPACKSEWVDDAIFDMNGNIDEWVDDDKGRFDGGFFSRSKKDGCLSSVGAHPKGYFDYSTGARCCLSFGDPPAPDLPPVAATPGDQGPTLGPAIKPFSPDPGPALDPQLRLAPPDPAPPPAP